MKVYRYNDTGQYVGFKTKPENYLLKQNETLENPKGYIDPVFIDGSWTESATNEIQQLYILPDIERRRIFEIPNLRAGAKRISSGFSGDEIEIDNKIAFATDKYKWANGELKVSEGAEAFYLLELSKINEDRVKNGKEELTIDDYKWFIKTDFSMKSMLLNTFNLYIETAHNKLVDLISKKEVSRSIQVIELMENVDRNTTREQAEQILNQILAI